MGVTVSIYKLSQEMFSGCQCGEKEMKEVIGWNI
jgi:hypothetical protein